MHICSKVSLTELILGNRSRIALLFPQISHDQYDNDKLKMIYTQIINTFTIHRQAQGFDLHLQLHYPQRILSFLHSMNLNVPQSFENYKINQSQRPTQKGRKYIIVYL